MTSGFYIRKYIEPYSYFFSHLYAWNSHLPFSTLFASCRSRLYELYYMRFLSLWLLVRFNQWQAKGNRKGNTLVFFFYSVKVFFLLCSLISSAMSISPWPHLLVGEPFSFSPVNTIFLQT